jgi:hypothetical protein
MADRGPAASGPISAEVTQLKSFATVARGGSMMAMIGALVMTIATALVSLGFSSGFFESVASARSALLLPPGGGSSSAATSSAASSPAGPCHSSSATAAPANP